MLTPKMEERWMTEIPDKLETRRACPLGLWMMPPRGWEVEPGEVEFIRHQMQAERVDLDGEVDEEKEKVAAESYETFLKQYTDWVEAYQDQLEEESYKAKRDPCRFRFTIEMFFVYPNIDHLCLQYGWNLFTPLSLIFGVHYHAILLFDGLTRFCIMCILQPICLLLCLIPVMCAWTFKFNRFDSPPIFHCPADANPEQLWRESGRVPLPRKTPPENLEE